jgi:hypothetical protein
MAQTRVTNDVIADGSITRIKLSSDAFPSANVQTFDSSGTWTKPASGSMARIQVWGGGGGGGRQSTGGNGGGGGGGGYNEIIVPFSSLNSTETVTIGAGGAGRINSNGAGNPGGNSFFGSHCAAYGGGAGNPGGQVSIGGGGGGPLSAASTTDGTPGEPILNTITEGFAIALGFGGTLTAGVFGIFHGGGGGRSGPGGGSIWGGGGGGGNNGAGGVSLYGGNGGAGGTPGAAGTVPGGGGGTGTSTSGDGAAGRVIVTVW